MFLTQIFQFISINPKSKQYQTSDGKQIVFHGVNVVNKLHPYLPETTGLMDYNTTVVDDDIKFLKRNGINFVRLGVMWPGVYPEADKINTTYLQETEKLINKMGQDGIYTLVDLHQDLLSTYYCGEGIPDWAVPYEISSAKAFPLPVMPNAYDRDPITHKIDRKLCLQKNFAQYYNSEMIGEILECLYNKTCNPFTNATEPKILILQDELKKYWSTVSKFFKNNEYVIGYDIINEPFPLNKEKHPEYKNQSKFDQEILQPFYQEIMKVIYEEDKNHIMFFEPTTIEMSVANFDVDGPGAAVGIPNEKQCFAFHVYCEIINEKGEPVFPVTVCKLVDKKWYERRITAGNNMQLNMMVNEFGALPNTEKMVEVLTNEVKLMANQMSWAYWGYKPFGDITTAFNEGDWENEGLFYQDMTLQKMKVRALFYPYLRICAGQIKFTDFDFEAEELHIEFKQGEYGQQSEITIGQLWVGWGKTISVIKGDVKVLRNANKIVIVNLKKHQDVKLTIK